MKRPHVRSERRNRLALIRAQRAVETVRRFVRHTIAEKRLLDALRALAATFAAAFPPDTIVRLGTVGAVEAP